MSNNSSCQTKNDKKALALDKIMIEYMLLEDENRSYNYLFDEMEKTWELLYNPTGVADDPSYHTHTTIKEGDK